MRNGRRVRRDRHRVRGRRDLLLRRLHQQRLLSPAVGRRDVQVERPGVRERDGLLLEDVLQRRLHHAADRRGHLRTGELQWLLQQRRVQDRDGVHQLRLLRAGLYVLLRWTDVHGDRQRRRLLLDPAAGRRHLRPGELQQRLLQQRRLRPGDRDQSVRLQRPGVHLLHQRAELHGGERLRWLLHRVDHMWPEQLLRLLQQWHVRHGNLEHDVRLRRSDLLVLHQRPDLQVRERRRRVLRGFDDVWTGELLRLLLQRDLLHRDVDLELRLRRADVFVLQQRPDLQPGEWRRRVLPGRFVRQRLPDMGISDVEELQHLRLLRVQLRSVLLQHEVGHDMRQPREIALPVGVPVDVKAGCLRPPTAL